MNLEEMLAYKKWLEDLKENEPDQSVSDVLESSQKNSEKKINKLSDVWIDESKFPQEDPLLRHTFEERTGQKRDYKSPKESAEVFQRSGMLKEPKVLKKDSPLLRSIFEEKTGQTGRGVKSAQESAELLSQNVPLSGGKFSYSTSPTSSGPISFGSSGLDIDELSSTPRSSALKTTLSEPYSPPTLNYKNDIDFNKINFGDNVELPTLKNILRDTKNLSTGNKYIDSAIESVGGGVESVTKGSAKKLIGTTKRAGDLFAEGAVKGAKILPVAALAKDFYDATQGKADPTAVGLDAAALGAGALLSGPVGFVAGLGLEAMKPVSTGTDALEDSFSNPYIGTKQLARLRQNARDEGSKTWNKEKQDRSIASIKNDDIDKDKLANIIASFESEGSGGYNAYNPGSKATGKYQIVPETPTGVDVYRKAVESAYPGMSFEEAMKSPERQEEFYRKNILPNHISFADRVVGDPEINKRKLNRYEIAALAQLGQKNVERILKGDELPEHIATQAPIILKKVRSMLSDDDNKRELAKNAGYIPYINPEEKLKEIANTQDRTLASPTERTPASVVSPEPEEISQGLKIPELISPKQKSEDENLLELYKQALDRKKNIDQSTYFAQAAEQLGAGLAGLSGYGVPKISSSDFYKQLRDTAAKEPESVLERNKVKEYENENDPTSEKSLIAKQLYKEYLGKDAPENLSYSTFSKIFPQISGVVAKREAAAARAEDKALKAQERNKELLSKQKRELEKRTEEPAKALLAFENLESSIRTNYLKDNTFSLDTFDINKYKGDLPGFHVPGLGRISIPFTQSEELRSDIDKVLNQAIRAFSGQAVTKNELERIKSQFGMGAFSNEKQMLEALAKAKKLARLETKRIESAFDKEAVDEFEGAGGVTSNYALTRPLTQRGREEKRADVQNYANDYFKGNYDAAYQFLKERGELNE